MPAVDDTFSFLEAQGLAGGSTGWTLLRRRQMDEPTAPQQVVLTEDGGRMPEIPEASGIGDSALRDTGVQVMVRGAPWDGDSTGDKAMDIYNALHGQRNIILGSTLYMRVMAQTPEPVFLGFDDRGRPRHTISFLLLSEA